jgi:hypothetical protein
LVVPFRFSSSRSLPWIRLYKALDKHVISGNADMGTRSERNVWSRQSHIVAVIVRREECDNLCN